MFVSQDSELDRFPNCSSLGHAHPFASDTAATPPGNSLSPSTNSALSVNSYESNIIKVLVIWSQCQTRFATRAEAVASSSLRLVASTRL